MGERGDGPTKTDTREAMLEAGVRLYGNLAGDLLRGLTAGAVAQEAGFHRQTFYRYWDTQPEYVQHLIRHLLEPSRVPVVPDAADSDLAGFVHELASSGSARLIGDRHAAMRLGLLMMQALNDGAPGDRAQAYYDDTMDQLGVAYAELLAGWDREPVPPMTARDIARIVHGLLLGLVVQSKAARDGPHGSALLEIGAGALLENLTQARRAD